MKTAKDESELKATCTSFENGASIGSWPPPYPIAPQTHYPTGYANTQPTSFNFGNTASQGYYHPYQADFYNPYAQSTAYQYPPMFGSFGGDVQRSSL
ncbi:hypothetical protein Tcan_18546 [Toxocara canis]|uniref:Uncharacterized protein n=1 Tax=Toxocara canis TaxID=6265 RepID=A0A0B2VQI2_TOXCA|nr:hypothetical protein Tcan_18546 [Toxocara canis]